MNGKTEPTQASAAQTGATASIGRSIIRLFIGLGLVVALSVILMAVLPTGRDGGLDFGESLPPPTVETFAAVIVMMFSIWGIVSSTRVPARKSGIVAYALVFTIGAAALWWLPQSSGLIAIGALAVLIAAPIWLLALSRHYELADRRRRAAVCLNLATFLHPSKVMRFYGTLLRARALGSSDAQIAAYASLKDGATDQPVVALLDSQAALARDDWAAVLDHSRGVPELKGYEIRALGELGHAEKMIAAFAGWQPKPRGRELDLYRLSVLAYAGRVDGVRTLVEGKLRFLRPERAAYFSFIAANAAGISDDSRRALTDHARKSEDEAFRRAAQRHLAAGRPAASPTGLSASSNAVIAEIESTFRKNPGGVRKGMP